MKKETRIVIIISVLFIASTMFICWFVGTAIIAPTINVDGEKGSFEEQPIRLVCTFEENDCMFDIYEHVETGVYYLFASPKYGGGRGGITAMLNSDGTPYTGG